MKIKILDLVLKRKWYDMIESGEKTEEYRDITGYWFSRINDRLTHVRFRRGYTKTAMIFEIKRISTGFGKVEWGAPKLHNVYIIKLGKMVKKMTIQNKL